MIRTAVWGERRALEETVENAAMGTFEKGTQGALRFEVQGIVNSIPWLKDAEPGLYDALQVPLVPAVGKLSRLAKA